MDKPKAARLVHYEERTSPVMLALAVLFLAVYSVQIIWQSIPPTLSDWLGYANYTIWLAFLVDLLVRVALAKHRVQFLRNNPIDVISVLLPALRPLRALRVFTAGQSLLSSKSGLVQTGQAIVFSAALLVYIGALALLDVESGHPDAMVTTFGDAIWWALVTVTTVGYGDLYPVTTEGRLVAGGLMLVGISVLGAVTATAASWFVRTSEEEREEIEGRDQKILAANQHKMSAKIDALEAKLDLLIERDGSDGAPPGGERSRERG
jgi:voltage-gated potassium channel